MKHRIWHTSHCNWGMKSVIIHSWSAELHAWFYMITFFSTSSSIFQISWQWKKFSIVSCISVVRHVQGYHTTPSQASLSPHSPAIMSCAHSVKEWMVVCQSCVAKVDSWVCHSSWITLVMHLPRKRAMKWVESWMGQKTFSLLMSFLLSTAL